LVGGISTSERLKNFLAVRDGPLRLKELARRSEHLTEQKVSLRAIAGPNLDQAFIDACYDAVNETWPAVSVFGMNAMTTERL
jgi:hypothetical protein